MDLKVRNSLALLDLGGPTSFEEARKKYLQLVLQFHPDKGNSHDVARFYKIQEAWKIASEYLSSSFVSTSICFHTIYKLEIISKDGHGLYYECRCGQNIELLPDSYFVECDSCSISYRVSS